MSSRSRRIAAIAEGRCSACLARPHRVHRRQCEVCSKKRGTNLQPITVRAATHARLCDLSRRLKLTLGETVAVVLGGAL